LGAGIVATVGANLAHGVGHRLVSAWPALALVGSFELLMMLIRTGRGTRTGNGETEPRYQPAPPLTQEAPPELAAAPTLEQTVHAHYEAGHSQRAIARELNIDRRKVKRILDQAA
jgi:DNA-binding NarL/FixJ family response regulator